MIQIKVCHGHMCRSNMSNYSFERGRQELGITDEEGGTTSDGKIHLCKGGCQGNCSRGPVVTVEKDQKMELHTHIDPVKMGKLVKQLKH